jgi:hypothetical protein
MGNQNRKEMKIIIKSAFLHLCFDSFVNIVTILLFFLLFNISLFSIFISIMYLYKNTNKYILKKDIIL